MTQIRLRRTMGGEWLHQDLPVQLNITEGVAGRNKAEGFVPAAFDVAAPDGLPMFLERGTTVYVEDDDGLGFVGLCSFTAPTRLGRTIEFGGLVSLYDLLPYEWVLAAWEPDPFDVLANFLDMGNSLPNGTLSVDLTVVGEAPTFLGDPQPPAAPAKPAQMVGESADAYDIRLEAWRDELDAWEDLYGNLSPYSIAWWEHKYIGEEIRTLAESTPFEVLERNTWTGPLSASHELVVGPVLGALRDDLALIQGVNLVGDIAPATKSETFGNDMWVLGPGEGAAMLRGRATADPDDRVRTTRFFEDKGQSNPTELNSEAANLIVAGQMSAPLATAQARGDSLPGLRPGDTIPVESDLFTGLSRVLEIKRSTAGGPISLTFDTGDPKR